MLIGIDVDLMRSLLDYDSVSGIVRRKSDTLTRKNKGHIVGQMTKKGYLQAKINGKSLLVHRVAYAIYHGVDPGFLFVDHIDGNKSNNAIANLRLCNNSQNLMNRSGATKVSGTGVRGVHYSKRERKFISYITVDRKLRRVGAFDDIDSAAKASAAARRSVYGEFCGVLP